MTGRMTVRQREQKSLSDAASAVAMSDALKLSRHSLNRLSQDRLFMGCFLVKNVTNSFEDSVRGFCLPIRY